MIQVIAAAGDNFWNFNVGHLIDLGIVAMAWLGYRIDKKRSNRERDERIEKERKEREGILEKQTSMHVENQQQLRHLADFHEEQMRVNLRRDEQIAQLQQQTVKLTQLAEGQERRLRMLEDGPGRRT